MPEVDGTRKRSRSPSDIDQEKLHKRANTGASTQQSNESSQAKPTASSISTTSLNDATMLDTSVLNSNDTAASTPTATAARSDANHMSSEKKELGSAASGSSSSATNNTPPSAMIHMRCLIVTQDASIIIGRGGKHVNEIREKSGARVMVSESIPGNPERILNVSGPLDAVSKVSFLCILESLEFIV